MCGLWIKRSKEKGTMKDDKPYCPICNDDVNIVELTDKFRCAYCGYIILKKGQLELTGFIK